MKYRKVKSKNGKEYYRAIDGGKSYYEKNKKRIIENATAWNKENKEKRKANTKKHNKKASEKKSEWWYKKHFDQKVEKTECELCGESEKQLIVHHKDKSSKRRDGHGNNKKSNLQVLCRSCHLKQHKDDIRKDIRS